MNPSDATKVLYFYVYVTTTTSFCIYKGLLEGINVFNFPSFPLTDVYFFHIFPVLFGLPEYIFFFFQMPDMILFLPVGLVLYQICLFRGMVDRKVHLCTGTCVLKTKPSK